MIVLRSPKGWTGINELDGVPIEGTCAGPPGAGHAGPHATPTHLAALEEWLRSYRPEELFDANGGPRPRSLAGVPDGRPAHGREPARRRRATCACRCNLPDARPSTRVDGPERAAPSTPARSSRSAHYLADVFSTNADEQNFRIVCPDEVASNRLGAVFEVENHAYSGRWTARSTPATRRDGRVMEMLSEHNCQGWLQGYVLTGRHGVFPCYEAFIPIVDGMVNQYGEVPEDVARRGAVARARSRR